MEDLAARAVLVGDDAEPAPGGHASSTSTPTPRTSSSPPMLYPYTDLPEEQIEDRVRRDDAPTSGSRWCGPTPATGPTGATSRAGRSSGSSTASTCSSDYGAFRDLQRHRMLTIEWQPLTPAPRLRPARGGRPAGRGRRASTRRWSARRRSTTRCAERFPAQAPYAVSPRLPGALRRCSSTPARRCTCSSCAPTPQGHPAYRRVCQEMHRLIAEQAGHHAVAELMRFVDHSPEPALERLEAERRAAQRRATR